MHVTKASTMTSECSKQRIPHVLTVAGSDSGAGAGIQADIKTCAARGVYCSSVITAVTAQNTVGVQDVNILPEGFVSEQLNSVMSDMHVDVVKTGMLPSIGIVKVLYHSLKEFPVQALVVDPVMVSTSGDVLAGPSILDTFRKQGVVPPCEEGHDVQSFYQPLAPCIIGTVSKRWIPIQHRSSSYPMSSSELEIHENALLGSQQKNYCQECT